MNTRTGPHTRPLISIAVYGTLKAGMLNHDCFCRGAVSIEGAVVRGRLYELPSGIPVLRVPNEDILAEGTRDPVADASTQKQLARVLARTHGERRCSDDWDWVHCELMTFDDPESRLPPIDRLEGFRPGQPSLYRRVLLPVFCESRVVSAWCYVAGESLLQNALPTGKLNWP